MLEVTTGETVTTARGDDRFFSVLACPDCGGFTVVEHNGPSAGYAMEVRSWPEDQERALDVGHLPDDVADYYADAKRCLDAGIPDAAAVQLRRTLEAAAAKSGHNERVLMQRIEALIDEGLVTKSFGAALHVIRVIGNQGAHSSDERVDQETAERALRFTTLFLRNLFEVPGELALMGPAEDPEEPEAPAPSDG
jgi:hypothetical protein